MANITEIVESIKGLSALELVELRDTLQEVFGVSAAAPVAAAAPTAAPTAAVEEEKTEFDVVLSAAGDKKIQVIKVVREITGLGLKEAKELVDSAPKAIKEKTGKEDAENVKKLLEAEGASVEIK